MAVLAQGRAARARDDRRARLRPLRATSAYRSSRAARAELRAVLRRAHGSAIPERRRPLLLTGVVVAGGTERQACAQCAAISAAAHHHAVAGGGGARLPGMFPVQARYADRLR